MTREEKIKAILCVADGTPAPPPETKIWLGYTNDTFKCGEKTYNRQQFDAYKKKHGGVHVVLSFVQSTQPIYIRRCDYEKMKAAGIEERPPGYYTIVEDEVKETTRIPATSLTPAAEPITEDIAFEEIEAKRKKDDFIKEMSWVDSPLCEMLSYMFPRQR